MCFPCFLQFCGDKDTLLKVWVKGGMCFERMQRRKCIFVLHKSPNRYLCLYVRVLIMVWTLDAVQRESGRAATPNRQIKFNDQLKWEPMLSGLRCFNALSLRA